VSEKVREGGREGESTYGELAAGAEHSVDKQRHSGSVQSVYGRQACMKTKWE
jgi:hypothetical protein